MQSFEYSTLFCIFAQSFMEKTHTYTLSELCQQVTQAIDFSFSDTCWVRTEIGSLMEKGGHCYLELVEKGSAGGLLAAKMRANCWANTYSMLSAFFLHETGEPLRAGMQVLLQGEVTFHSVYGLSFQITGIDPAYTLGAVAKQRQQTIARLQADGVMEMNKHLELPTLLRHIAVISAPEAAGYGDFCHQLQNNALGFSFHTELFPAIMQGDKAEASILDALGCIFRREHEFQAVVIIRGGGAATDLHCFDSYELALCCAQFPLPIIAGIGHQRDVSVLDMVAHTTVKTPTAAAEFLIGHMTIQYDRLHALGRRLNIACQQHIRFGRQTLEQKHLRLSVTFRNVIHKEHNRLDFMEKNLLLHSPEKIYRMGYTLTRCNGNIVRNAGEVQSGTRLTTEFHDGIVISVVE